ncbi:hypothetical protein [Selenomonas ruminantium]|uniref:Helix-turn-helix domain of resolvase n=1 Tax=Selenomonas ruminantium TaxID=971 RepID=A0A1H0UFQ9_SELRU|nr:hypothetical protein [Selenomonas ruminantium]SDP64900.1 hypothetical protein SAMN05216366_13215 [Selenomonas ruminantium]
MMKEIEEQQLIEKYRQLSADGRIRINCQIDCELRIDRENAERRRQSQRKGIEAAQKAGVHYGRPKSDLLADWDVVYQQWKQREITAADAAKKLGISKATLYRMAKARTEKVRKL